jgi:dienelactone hydrolase
MVHLIGELPMNKQPSDLLSVQLAGLLRRIFVPIWLFLAISASHGFAAELPVVAGGKFSFEPLDESRVPEPFRLEVRRDIPFQTAPMATTSQTFAISAVTFPSPVETPHANNNTVHCEYFCAAGDGKRPGVIVLHILGGDFDLSRLFCRALTTRGCSALFVKMPYYGPRRQPDVATRMVSRDPHETVRGMTQAVKDVRYATAWLANRPEIDADQLGIMGISLGGITGALTLTAEPRLHKAFLMLAGGDVAQVAWETKKMRQLREQWEANGGTKDSFFALMRTVDPAAYGDRVRDRKILMINARHDEIIPAACAESLWKSFGEPPIVWLDAGHISAARYIFDGLDKATKFFEPQLATKKIQE